MIYRKLVIENQKGFTVMSNDFMLSQARRIISVNEIPEDGENNVAVILSKDSNGNIGLLGPIFMSKTRVEQDGDVHIYIKDGFKGLPEIQNKLKLSAENPSVTYRKDPMFDLGSGIVKSNDFSWESIVRAHKVSPGWSELMFGALGESVARAIEYRQVEYPSKTTNTSSIIANLSLLNTEDRFNTHIDKNIVDYFTLSTWEKNNAHKTNKSKNKISRNQELQRDALYNIVRTFGQCGVCPNKLESWNKSGNIFIDRNEIGRIGKSATHND